MYIYADADPGGDVTGAITRWLATSSRSKKKVTSGREVRFANMKSHPT